MSKKLNPIPLFKALKLLTITIVMTFSFSRWQAEARRIGGDEGVTISETDEALTLVTFSLLTAPVIQRFPKPRGIEVCCFQNEYLKC